MKKVIKKLLTPIVREVLKEEQEKEGAKFQKLLYGRFQKVFQDFQRQ